MPGFFRTAMDAPLTTMHDSPARPLQFADIQALVADDAARVDALIRTRLASSVALINQVGEHIIAGGKRLRPLVVLLAAQAVAGQAGNGNPDDDGAIAAAAIIEFIHTATLLHDDVVDESDRRRGQATANALFGNAASVLVGDFLYTRSFQLMVGTGSMPLMRLLADTTNAIAEGEVLQLMHLNNPDTRQDDYLRVIERKTAILFAAAAELGPLLAGAPVAQQQGLRRYGHCLGMAFQIADDLLDYVADESRLGKQLGDDLAEGKPTMPLIHALEHAAPAEAEQLRRAIREGGREHMPAVLAAIQRHGSLDHARQQAETWADQAIAALDVLPASAARDALAFLAGFAIARQS